jgi:hypothetical protein
MEAPAVGVLHSRPAPKLRSPPKARVMPGANLLLIAAIAVPPVHQSGRPALLPAAANTVACPPIPATCCCSRCRRYTRRADNRASGLSGATQSAIGVAAGSGKPNIAPTASSGALNAMQASRAGGGRGRGVDGAGGVTPGRDRCPANPRARAPPPASSMRGEGGGCKRKRCTRPPARGRAICARAGINAVHAATSACLRWTRAASTKLKPAPTLICGPQINRSGPSSNTKAANAQQATQASIQSGNAAQAATKGANTVAMSAGAAVTRVGANQYMPLPSPAPQRAGL